LSGAERLNTCMSPLAATNASRWNPIVEVQELSHSTGGRRGTQIADGARPWYGGYIVASCWQQQQQQREMLPGRVQACSADGPIAAWARLRNAACPRGVEDLKGHARTAGNVAATLVVPWWGAGRGGCGLPQVRAATGNPTSEGRQPPADDYD
jgi:hypothetical protein